MADFFTRLVSRTLSGLEPTVKPLIAPIYASGATMADNYAVDSAPEWGLSVSEEYASTEYPVERSPESLGISAAETLNFASNVTPINWREIQLPNSSSERVFSEQFQPDTAISPKVVTNDSSTEESSLPIAFSNAPITTQSSDRDTVKVTPTPLDTIQPLDNPSEIASGEQTNPNNTIAPESSIKASSTEDSSPPITPSIAPSTTIQKSSSQDPVKVNPTSLEPIQPLDNPSEIASGEPLEADRAIASENSIKASSPEESSPPIAFSNAPITTQSSGRDTVKVHPTPLDTIQPLDNPSEIVSRKQTNPNNMIAPESSIKSSSTEESSSPIAPSLAPSNVIQSSQDTVNVTPTSLEPIQPLENSSEIASGEPLEADMAIAPESSIKASSPEKSSPPITPSIAPSNIIQKSTSAEVNPASNSIQPASESGIERSLTLHKTANEPQSRWLVKSQVADVNKNSSLDNSSASSSPVSKLTSQLSSNQNSETENPIAGESSLLQLNNQSSPERAKKVSLPLVRSGVIAPFSSLPLNPSGQVEPPVNRVESIQSIEINPASELNIPATSSSLPQSDLADTGLSPPSSPSTSSSPSPKSFPTKNVVKNQIFPLVQSGETRIMRAAKRISSRSPIASETVSRSPGSSEIKTGAIKPQNTSFTTSLSQPSNSQEISSADTMTPIPFNKGELTSQLLTDSSPNKSMTTVTNSQNFSSPEDKTSNPSRLGITTQSKLVEEEAHPEQVLKNKREKIDSNLSNIGNTLSFLGEKDLAHREADLFDIARHRLRQTESIPLKIEPRLEITSQELPQSPEQLSKLPFRSNSQSPSRHLSETEGLETTNISPRKLTNANAESTPTINITIGRVEVRGVKPPEPLPVKKSRSKTPQLSLSDYLKQRGGNSNE